MSGNKVILTQEKTAVIQDESGGIVEKTDEGTGSSWNPLDSLMGPALIAGTVVAITSTGILLKAIGPLIPLALVVWRWAAMPTIECEVRIAGQEAKKVEKGKIAKVRGGQIIQIRKNKTGRENRSITDIVELEFKGYTEVPAIFHKARLAEEPKERILEVTIRQRKWRWSQKRHNQTFPYEVRECNLFSKIVVLQPPVRG